MKQIPLNEELGHLRQRYDMLLAENQMLWGEQEAENRKKVRDLLFEHVLSRKHENYWLTQEERRKQWFKTKFGIEFPESGRLILEYSDMNLMDKLRKEYWKEWNDVEGVDLLYFNPEKDHIRDLATKAYFSESNGPHEWKDYYGNIRSRYRDPSHREICKPIVLSIALEDFLFCSDYAAYSSCMRICDLGEYAGGGRVFAGSINCAILLREDTQLVNVGYYAEKHNDSVNSMWDSWPQLPKKMGRRFVYFDSRNPTHYALGRSYGTLRWSALPVIDIFQSKNIRIYPRIDCDTLSWSEDLDLEYYTDEVGREVKDGNWVDFVLEEARLAQHRNIHIPREIEVEELMSRCSNCGERHVELEYNDSEGNPLCESCYSNLFFYCDVCDNYRSIDVIVSDEVRSVRGGYIVVCCDVCYEDVKNGEYSRYELVNPPNEDE